MAFTKLEQAIAEGFERQNRAFASMLQSQVASVRSDMSAFEHRMLRRFDDVDVRMSTLEEHVERIDGRLALINAKL